MKILPRILLITRNLPPLIGGMEKLNWYMASGFSEWASVQTVGPTGSRATLPHKIEGIEVPHRPLWLFILRSTFAAISSVFRRKPALVMAGSGVTAPIAWGVARLTGAKCCVYLHGLDIAIQHSIYRALWLPAIRNMDYVIANSSATYEIALRSGVDKSKLNIVHPGVSIPDVKKKDRYTDNPFRKNYGLDEGPILLSVGRLTERKGLREFVRDVLPSIMRQRPDVQLVVIGEMAANALVARSQTPDSIMNEARLAGLEANRIHFIGVITDEALLGEAYSSAAAHVFPVREIPGDPEGFGMVAIEAAAYGLPTVAYATGGVVDAVSHGNSGILVNPGDTEGFATAVCNLLQNALPKSRITDFASQFAWMNFGKKLKTALAGLG